MNDLIITMPLKTTAISNQNSGSNVNTVDVNISSEQQRTTNNEKQNIAESNKTNSWDDVIISLIAGATAGALAKTTIAPLDRTKINFQINKYVPYSLAAAYGFIRNTYEKEGFFSLWRGNSATMARIIPYAAIQFTAHEQWRKLLKVDQNKETKIRRFVAGSLAGVTSQSLTYPLDLARARMAVTDKYSSYNTLRQVFIRIWVDEGPRTLYRGYFATILGVIPYAGGSFFTYETLKKKYCDMSGNTKLSMLTSLFCGACSGVVGQTFSYPLDIVRRRMQTMGVLKDSNQYNTIFSTLKKIYREEGVKKGFFKGLSMNWIKGPIAVGISFSTYDSIKELIRELHQYKRGRFS